MKATGQRGHGTAHGYACAVGAAAFWALSATVAKSLFSSKLDPLSVAQARVLLGFLCLWPVLYWFRRPLVRLHPRDIWFVALQGLTLASMQGTYYLAIARMPVAVAILIQYLAPLLILVYLRCFARRPVGRTLWVAAALCLVGCALVTGMLGHAEPIARAGLVAGTASAVAYAAYILLAEAGGRRLSSWTLLCYALGAAALFWGIFKPWWLFPLNALTPHTVALLLFIAVFGTLLPLALIGRALRTIAPGPAGIVTTAEPVIAAGLAYLILGEQLGLAHLFGGVLVLAGIVLAQRVGATPIGNEPAGDDHRAGSLWHTSRSAVPLAMADKRTHRWRVKAAIAGGITVVLCLIPTRLPKEPHAVTPEYPVPKPAVAEVVIPLPQPPPKRTWHSRHQVKTWLTRYEGRIYRTTQFPRCEHVEMVVTYMRAPGQTVAQARKRAGAFAASTGSYHHPKTMALADFVKKDGRVLMNRRTTRAILATDPPQVADILDDIVRGERTSAVALGSRLVPFHLDGFSPAFANQRTDRMAIGLTKGYVFIVQGNTDLWRLSRFMRDGLGCTKAVNCDGGHVVKGRGPVHITFRWRKQEAEDAPVTKPVTP